MKNEKKKKKPQLNFKHYLLASGWLLVAVIFLIGISFGTNFADQKIHLVGDNLEIKSENFKEQVAGVSTAPPVLIQNAGIKLPSLSAKAVIALDVDNDRILYEKNSHLKLAPASTTKVMTALIASEYFKSADVLTVSSGAMVGGSNMGLSVGESLSFRSLLYGMLLNSGNDAAFAIALNYPGGLTSFVTVMNRKVEELGLKDTHFDNPAGFDGPDHFSSAYDLAKIAEAAIASPQLAKVVSTKETLVYSWDKSKVHQLKNLNSLLSEDGVLGIKTGFTEKAGENFVGLVERDNHRVITVVLDSVNRFGESKQLMDWVYKNFTWTESHQ